jgi:hypothetical protein
MVRGGLAWWYRKYAPGNVAFEKLEAEAKGDKRGLWADPNPIPPWDYRKLHPGYIACQEDLDALHSEMPGVSPRGPPTLSPLAQEDVAPSAHPILGNRKSRIYHRPDCPNYSQIALRNRVTFKTEQKPKRRGIGRRRIVRNSYPARRPA